MSHGLWVPIPHEAGRWLMRKRGCTTANVVWIYAVVEGLAWTIKDGEAFAFEKMPGLEWYGPIPVDEREPMEAR